MNISSKENDNDSQISIMEIANEASFSNHIFNNHLTIEVFLVHKIETITNVKHGVTKSYLHIIYSNQHLEVN